MARRDDDTDGAPAMTRKTQAQQKADESAAKAAARDAAKIARYNASMARRRGQIAEVREPKRPAPPK